MYQTIINLIPPHRRYFELFAGGAAIFRRKTPAELSVLLELNPAQAARLEATYADRRDVIVMRKDALEALRTWRWGPADFIYIDPPYLHSTRSCLDLYGEFEMTEQQHCQVLSMLTAMGDRQRFCLSGYRNAMYDDAAASAGWHRIDFPAMTRGGPRTESVWINYQPSAVISDYTYVGCNFRERERIKRKVARWSRRLASLEPMERAALLSALRRA